MAADLYEIIGLVLKVARADKSAAATMDAPAVMNLIARSGVLEMIEAGIRSNKAATAKTHAIIAEMREKVRAIDEANERALVERVRAAIPSALDHAHLPSA